ncbi:MAG: rhodanese-like domain-containing protein [Oscillospiraceae bacterium]|nr:rhodanese-like domain-containing protein [Oscillospiraceae bacterium]
MKKLKFFIPALALTMLFAGCGQVQEETPAQPQAPAYYVSITAEEAKKLMDSAEDYVIVDVRTQSEYDEGHIPGAVLIPDTEIARRAEEELPDKGQLILVYCRSGRRSKLAADALAQIGYTNIKEFGGIIDWPYEIEK